MSSDSARGWAGRCVALAFVVLVVLLTIPWQALSPLPTTLAAMRPDYAFELAQGEITRLGLRYGVETIWTYGPLGFLLFDLCFVPVDALGWVVGLRVVLACVFALAWWCVLWPSRDRAVGCARALGRVLRAAGLLVIALAARNGEHSMFWMSFGLLAVVLDEGRCGARSTRGLAIWCAIAAGVIATSKGTHALFGLAICCVMLGREFARGRRARLPWTAIALAVSFGLTWVVLGQRLGDLPAYFARLLDLSGGYGEAMAKGFIAPYGGLDVSLFALAVGSIAVGFGALVARRRRTEHGEGDGRSLVPTALTVALLLVLSSKHAFGGNQLGNATSTLAVLTLLCASVGAAARPDPHAWSGARTLVTGALVVGFVSCVGLWARNDAWMGRVLREPLTACTEVVANAAAIGAGLDPHRVAHATLLGRVRALADLPADLGGTLDALGDLPVLASTHPTARYAPRPMYLSLNAHTEAIARWNAEYFASDAAPGHVVVDLFSLPGVSPFGRYPSLSDGPAWFALLAHYRVVGLPGGRPLLRRRADVVRIEQTASHASAARFGEWLDVPPLDADSVSVEITAPLSRIGRVIERIYKSPRLSIEVTTDDGVTHTFELVEPMARAGFLLSPLVDDGLGFALWHARTTSASVAATGPWPVPRRALRLRILEVDDGPRCRDADGLRVRWVGLRAAPESLDRTPSPAALEFAARLHGLRQRVVAALFPPTVESADDPTGDADAGPEPPVLRLHAPAQIELAARDLDGVRALELEFGMQGTAWNGTDASARSDGAVYRLVDATGRELWSRALDPAQRPSDRGRQRAAIDLTAPPPRGLTLRIEPGPAGAVPFDHTYIGDLRFVR